MYALILGDLEAVDMPLLSVSSVPYRDPVGDNRNDKGIVDLAPVEDVKAAD
jgi:hypothetical protein